MDFTNNVILLTGLLFLVSVLASVISARIGMPLLLVFLALGMLAGEEGPGGIHFEYVQATHLVGSLALAVILFDGGLSTQVSTFRVGLWPAVGLATVGVVVTAAITGLAAAWFLELDWVEGLLVGAIVGSTDAAAVFALLHAQGLQLKQRADATLQLESGMNDPMAVFLTITLVSMLEAGRTEFGWPILGQFVLQMGIGAAAGLLGGWSLAWLMNRITLSEALYPLLSFSGGLLIYGVAAVLNGSGFLAVYLAGLLLGNRPLKGMQNVRRFHVGMAWLSQITMFLILGLLVTPSHLLPVAVESLLIALALILLARPAAVLLCLLPFRFPWREQVFIGWVGLRGAVPIILALFPMLADLEHAKTFFDVAFFVVLISLVVQGWTVTPAARLLGLDVPPRPGAIQRVQLDLPGQPSYELVGYRVAPESPAAHYSPERLPVPQSTKPVAVIRGVELLETAQVESLKEGDQLYLLAREEDLHALDRVFAAVDSTTWLEEQRFFGELVLDPDTRVAEFARFYGLDVGPGDDSGTLADLLLRAFGRPVVGDRVKLGSVELVVREMADGRILKVGMKLKR